MPAVESFETQRSGTFVLMLGAAVLLFVSGCATRREIIDFQEIPVASGRTSTALKSSSGRLPVR